MNFDDWELLTLGDITQWFSGGTPKKDCPEYWNGDIPWISANSMEGNRYTTSELKITPKGLDAGSRLAKKESILLLVRGGALHNKLPVGIALNDVAFNQDVKALTVDNKKLNPWFLLYWFLGQKDYLLNRVVEFTGIGAGKLDTKRMQALPIKLPPLISQLEIVSVIKALDDRISLLRETNTTLEAIAQTLFKSWFVDFDPVKAKAEGKQPEGMDEATAALFPSEFEESALRLIPKGWDYCSFMETVNVIGGGTPKTSIPEYWSGTIPWFSVVDVPSKSDIFVIDTEKHITELGLNNSSTKLLEEGTTIISARGTVGRLALVGTKMAMNQSCYGLQGKTGDIYFTYFTTSLLVESLKQRAHGSVFDTITRDTLAGVLVVYPNIEIIQSFESIVSVIMARIKTNLLQSQTLATLRDTLLPRLISGQLRVNQAQDLINEAEA